jgi:hypothetical protein
MWHLVDSVFKVLEHPLERCQSDGDILLAAQNAIDDADDHLDRYSSEMLSARSIMDGGTAGGDCRDQPIAAPHFALHVQPSGSRKHDGFIVGLRVQPLGRTDIAARVQAVEPVVTPGSEQKRGHAAVARTIAERSHGAVRRGPPGLRSQPPKKAATVCTRFPATAGSAKRPMRLVARH